MKARSKKILGSAVVAAASVACALPAAKAAVPILYEVSATSSTTVAGSGGTVSFDVLALVTGSNASAADDGFISGQFSLIQTPGAGVTAGALSFSLANTYQPSASDSSNTAVFGSVPAAVGGSIGAGAAATGSANDTIIGYAGVTNSGPSATFPGAVGTTSVSGAAYNIFHVGSGTLTLPTEPSGALDSLTLVPRGGLGNAVKPQIAIIDGTAEAFRGDDTANVGVVSPLSISLGSAEIPGDANGDGKVDSSDFFILVNNFGATGTNGGPSVGDFNNDHNVDSSDFFILVNNFGFGTGSGAGLEAPSLSAVAVPEPTSLALIAAVPLLGMRRRRAK